jgi:hypothetical protein
MRVAMQVASSVRMHRTVMLKFAEMQFLLMDNTHQGRSAVVARQLMCM